MDRYGIMKRTWGKSLGPSWISSSYMFCHYLLYKKKKNHLIMSLDMRGPYILDCGPYRSLPSISVFNQAVVR